MSERPDSGLEKGPFLLHRNKGREHFEAEEYARARRNLELAHRIHPDDPDVMYWLGMSYFRLDQHQEAQDVFARLIRLRPGVGALHVNRGIVLYKMGRSAEAEEEFKRAIDLEGAGNRPHLYLGLIEARKGSYQTALDHFQRAGADVLAARMKAKMQSSSPRWEGARTPTPVQRRPDEPKPTAGPPQIPAPSPHPVRPATNTLMAIREESSASPDTSGDTQFIPHGRYLVEVEFREMLLVRRGALAGYAGALRFEASSEEEDLLRVHGDGKLVLVGEGRRLTRVLLPGDEALHVEVSRFVACDRNLKRELISLGRKDGLGLRAVGLSGEGGVVMATGGDPLALDVRPEAPVSVAADLLVGWWGNLTPTLVRQGTMEDRAIRGSGGALKLRFQGQGRLLLDHRRDEGL